MSGPLDLGSPMPSLVDSHDRSLQYFNSSLGGSSRRRNTASSASSTGRSVDSALHSTSTGPPHHRNNNQNTRHPGSLNHNNNPKGFSRPKMNSDKRFSALSSISTAPSTHLQTPGLSQDGFNLSSSALGINVEVEEEDGLGGGDDGHSDSRKGERRTDKHVNGGKMIAERRRQFENTSVTKSGIQQQTKPTSDRARLRSTRQMSPHDSEAVNGTTSGAELPSASIDQVVMKAMESAPSTTADPHSSTRPPKNPNRTIGLGLDSVVTGSEIGGDWLTDLESVQREIAAASKPLQSPEDPGRWTLLTQERRDT